MRTRVKICGITRAQDGFEAARLGVDAIGLVFYDRSPRNVSCHQAVQICRALPAFVSTVALFMNPDASQVKQVLDSGSIDVLQFHGSESAEFCESFSHPYIKAVGMADEDDLSRSSKQYVTAKGLLLDSHVKGGAGGTGEVFDWQNIPQQYRHNIILAGGLKPSNVAEAIQTIRPYAVDLSSGVESAPGIKDVALMTQLMKEVNRADVG